MVCNADYYRRMEPSAAISAKENRVPVARGGMTPSYAAAAESSGLQGKSYSEENRRRAAIPAQERGGATLPFR